MKILSEVGVDSSSHNQVPYDVWMCDSFFTTQTMLSYTCCKSLHEARVVQTTWCFHQDLTNKRGTCEALNIVPNTCQCQRSEIRTEVDCVFEGVQSWGDFAIVSWENSGKCWAVLVLGVTCTRVNTAFDAISRLCTSLPTGRQCYSVAFNDTNCTELGNQWFAK